MTRLLLLLLLAGCAKPVPGPMQVTSTIWAESTYVTTSSLPAPAFDLLVLSYDKINVAGTSRLSLESNPIYWLKHMAAQQDRDSERLRQFIATYSRGGMIQPDRVSDADRERAKKMAHGKEKP